MKTTRTAGLCALGLIGSLALAPAAKAGLDPFLGEVMLVAMSYCPKGWVEADGRLLGIAQNSALFAIYSVSFGGDGVTTFGLPDLRGRIVVGTGPGAGLPPDAIGQASGSTTKTMTTNTLPSHSHVVNATNLDGDLPGPGNKLLAAAPTGGAGNETIYSTAAPNVTMNPAMIAVSGNSAAFSTQDPTIGLLHCVATSGLFPMRP